MKSVKSMKTCNTEIFQKYLNSQKSPTFGIGYRFDWHNENRDKTLKCEINGQMKKKINRSCSFDNNKEDAFELRGRLADYSARKAEYSVSKRVLGRDNSVYNTN
jgi:hypothetical protein